MIKYALLGLLREGPDHGYRLKKRFDERIGSLWQLNAGQVYQILHALKRSGLVSESMTEDDGKERDLMRPRRVFVLTAKGQRVLERWLSRAPARARPARDETLLRLLVLAPDRHAEAAGQIDKISQIYHQQAQRLLAEKRRLPVQREGALLVREIGLEADLLHTEAHLKWLDFTAQRLREMSASVPPQGGARNGCREPT